MLRGASAEAQADLTSELESSKGDADKLVEELFGVAAVLRGEPAVRRILTDASVESDAKASLAGDIFGNSRIKDHSLIVLDPKADERHQIRVANLFDQLQRS